MKTEQIRFSQLKLMAQSPAHYLHALKAPRKRARQLDVGTVAHSMVLGGPVPVVFPGKVRRGKEWEAFEAAHAGRLILNASEFAAAAACADAVLAHPGAMHLLEGQREQELLPWEIAGRVCGGRPDVIASRHICELKTSVTSAPWRFPHLALRMGYHAQLAWYLDGHAAAGGTAKDAYVIAVESTPPHVVTVYQLTPRAIEAGRRQYRIWFERLRVCEESDVWPGYSQTVEDLDTDDDEDVELSFGEQAPAAAGVYPFEELCGP